MGVTLIIPLAFIMQQPDLGTSLVFLAITAALIIVAGITWKIIFPIFLGGLGMGGLTLMDGVLYAGFFSGQFWF